jgi:prepilin-type N-terminal cleavage/methylation domain-containing protein/prepilin-type processing-associated H-X9-DG protein
MTCCRHRNIGGLRRRRGWPVRGGFTLIELLVVVAIIGLLVSILLPTLSAARKQAQSAKCLANLHVLGHGFASYMNNNADTLPGGRLGKISGETCKPWAMIYGRRKYRPTFLALMSSAVGAPPFDDPQACKNTEDMHGEPGDQQNYAHGAYVCPTVAEWTDERNGSYGYNYHFLGNARTFAGQGDYAYKNWPVPLTRLKYPGDTVAAGDCMGTAAHYRSFERAEYLNNGRDDPRYGNEGFNLDPPRLDPVNGEIADHDPLARSAAHDRHLQRANMLFVDGHAGGMTLEQLGYRYNEQGTLGYEGLNVLWTGDKTDRAWTPSWPR